jgi:hypothetical protein
MEKGVQLRNYHVRRGKDKDNTPLYPITKAENIIGGAGVTQVTELPATGDEGKIYYNTTEKKYYTYTEENGWSELGSGSGSGGSDGPTYELKYQYNPMFCGRVNLNGELPSCLDDLGFIKEGTTIVVNKDAEDDTEYSRGTMRSNIAGDNVDILGLALEDEFSNYLATLGIDWYNVDRSTISDITHNITVDLFDMRNLYDEEMSNIQDEWVVCKYTVNFEISVEETENGWVCVANGTVTSREYITSGTIIYPKMHIKYLMQPKGIIDGPNEEQIPTCGLAIDTMGICRGTVNRRLSGEEHELGNSGFALYGDINLDNPTTSLEIILRFGECMSTIFEFPLFGNLNIVGRFFAGDPCSINIDYLIPAENNPDIEGSSVYEYHIMYPTFSLIKLFTD